MTDDEIRALKFVVFYKEHGVRASAFYENNVCDTKRGAKLLMASLKRQGFVFTTQTAKGGPTGRWYPTDAGEAKAAES